MVRVIYQIHNVDFTYYIFNQNNHFKLQSSACVSSNQLLGCKMPNHRARINRLF